MPPVAVPHSDGESRTLLAVPLRFLLFGLKQPTQYFLKSPIWKKRKEKAVCKLMCAAREWNSKHCLLL